MNVNTNISIVNRLRAGLILGLLLFAAVFFFRAISLYRSAAKTTFSEERAALLARQIGHHVLLQAGDRSSRVLPVKRLSKGVFQLRFEHEFSFMPDSLLEIVQHALDGIRPPQAYTVNVIACISEEIVYGFEIDPQYREIVPCRGRGQPKGCYIIQIAFKMNTAKTTPAFAALFSGLAALGLLLSAGFAWVYFRRTAGEAQPVVTDGVRVGKYTFSASSQLLEHPAEKIMLSDKETQLLTIFAARQNELITRDELLKRVWEDDGVFTGRSLDMFISKLRKKLQNDPTIQLTNVHGRGYKLETTPFAG